MSRNIASHIRRLQEHPHQAFSHQDPNGANFNLLICAKVIILRYCMGVIHAFMLIHFNNQPGT